MACGAPGALWSPVSGSEPEWNPSRWEANTQYNNCYAYALDDREPQETLRHRKPIPGPHRSYYTCSQVIEGLKDEVPQMYVASFGCPCASGFKKIYAAVSDEGEDNDFHFWRQDRDGWWSHKPGSDDPSRTDGDQRPIANPDQANRHSSTRHYSQGCGFFCIPVGSHDKPS